MPKQVRYYAKWGDGYRVYGRLYRNKPYVTVLYSAKSIEAIKKRLGDYGVNAKLKRIPLEVAQRIEMGRIRTISGLLKALQRKKVRKRRSR